MKTKTNEELIRDYVKSNKQRRERIIAKAGFTNEADYLCSLTKPTPVVEEEKPKTRKPRVKKAPTKIATSGDIPVIHNVMLLDASGSMSGSKYNNMKDGVATELRWISQQSDVLYTVTISEFIQMDRISIKSNEIAFMGGCDITPKFHGAHGNDTPLYKAIIDMLTKLEAVVPKSEKVLVKVYTDGGNNVLGQYQQECADLIKKLNSENYTITFVGTDYDISNITNRLKVDSSNCLKISNTGAGFKEAFERSLDATAAYSKSVVKNEDVSVNFYSKKLIN